MEHLQRIELLMIATAVALLAMLWWSLRTRGNLNSRKGGYQVVPFTSSGPFRVGARTVISVVGEEGTEDLSGTVEEIGRLSLVISVPLTAAMRLGPGTSTSVMMPDKPAAHRFTGLVLERRNGQKTLLVEFARPAWVERIQRRSHFRVPLNLPTTVNHVDRVRPSDEVFDAVLSDLSAGGVTILTPFKPDLNTVLRVRVPLSGLNASYEVRVLRAQRTPRTPKGMWEVGAEFISLDEASQDRIMRACFDVERANRASAG